MKTNKKILLCSCLSLTAFTMLAGCGNGQNNTKTEFHDNLILNGGFESGIGEKIEGWSDKGLGAFSPDNVTNATTVNGIEAGKVGTYFFSGIESSLPSYTGKLESDYFKLGGLGYVSFKMGAAKDTSKIYIQFYKDGSDKPLAFKANGGDVEVDKIGNDDFNGTTCTDQMVQKYVDLSEYIDEIIKIVVVDEDTNSEVTDYSYVNFDDFRIIQNASEKNEVINLRKDELKQYEEKPFEEDETSTSLRNGGFETGDLTGWKVLSGDALNEDFIEESANTFWGERQFYAEGNYFLNGFKVEGTENRIGKMRSEKFTIENTEGNKYVSFRIGGAKFSTAYVSIIDAQTNSEVARVTNKEFSDPKMSLNMHEVFVDVTACKGKVLYFLIVDESQSEDSFKAIVVDDFKINLSKEDIIDEITALKTATYEEDSVAKDAYIALYNGGYSYPLAGNAPTIKEENGYALVKEMAPTNNVDLNRLLNEVTVSDDYTATNDLSRSIVSAKLGNNLLTEVDYNSFNFDKDGDYYISIKVTDNYEQSSESVIKVTVKNDIVYDNQITNGGFETGDLTGWTIVSGNVVTDDAINSDTTFWAEQIPYNKSGEYFFNGWTACPSEPEGYTLRSTTFTLSGSGYISFKMGGAASAVKVYTADGELIADYRNNLFADVNFPSISNGCRLATMNGYVANLSEYLNQNLYIEISDLGNIGGWSVAFFDEIVTYYETAPDYTTMKDTVREYIASTDSYNDVVLNYSEAINTL